MLLDHLGMKRRESEVINEFLFFFLLQVAAVGPLKITEDAV